MIARLENALFARRGIVLAVFALLTVVLGYQASQTKIDAGFEKQLPLEHPYMKTFMEYREELGGANRLLVAVRAKDGDIFTPEFMETLDAVTDEVFYLPGVNRSTVTSVFTPNVRFIEVVEGGFTGGNVVPADFQPTEDGIGEVRRNILKAGIVGRLVSNDFTAALITAELVERDPETGGRLDYIEVSRLLEEKIRDPFVGEAVDIHIIGFAKVIGNVAEGAKGVVGFFGIAFAITAFLVYGFTHSVRLTLLPLLCSIVAVIWTMGLLTTLGFGIDPMSILVPFLVFAIGVSHGVQMTNAVGASIGDGATGLEAGREAFRKLVTPGAVALLSDTVGFLTILLIDIRIIQELAITASLGVGVILFTNLLLLPVLLSYVNLGDRYRERAHRGAQLREKVWSRLARVTETGPAIAVLVLAVALFGFGMTRAPDLAIGDLHAGVPELRPDSRYNRDTALITERFSIGVDILTTLVETVPDGCIAYDVMEQIDRFHWHLSNVPGVQFAISLPYAAKIYSAGWNEGNLKWRILPRNEQTMVQAVKFIDTSTGLLNSDCSVMPVLAFTEDHKAETLERVVAAVKEFAAENDSDRHRFRLATGNAGVMAATNEVVRDAQTRILLWVYAAVVALCLLSFRSIRATLCIVLPLSLVSVLCYALMHYLEIGLKVSTLPVAALGVGIGVDYGIYLFSRMRVGLAAGKTLGEAYLDTLRVTGNAILVTGLTLGLGVSTWAFSDLQFQADMGILLAFMFLANMLGALVLLPALARFLLPRSSR